MCKEMTYNFKRDKILERCEKFELLSEQITYLECVLKEYKTNPPDLDENYGIVPTLEDWLETQLRWFRFLEETEKSNAGGVAKIRGKNIDIDIVRIFDAMMTAKMISSKTEVSQIVRLFFREQAEINKNVAQYNARIGEINKEQHSNSKILLEFVKILLEKSFKGKDKTINELQDFLDKLH